MFSVVNLVLTFVVDSVWISVVDSVLIRVVMSVWNFVFRGGGGVDFRGKVDGEFKVELLFTGPHLGSKPNKFGGGNLQVDLVVDVRRMFEGVSMRYLLHFGTLKTHTNSTSTATSKCTSRIFVISTMSTNCPSNIIHHGNLKIHSKSSMET